MIAELAAELKREAERANERRLLVLAGDRDRGFDAAYETVEAVGVDDDAVTIVSTREGFRFPERRPRAAGELLGRTREVVVFDCHDRFVPNALGQVTGAVDGGGLLVLLTPDLDDWPRIRDGFDETLAVPPYGLSDVTGRFRTRVVRTLRRHPGVAIVGLDDRAGESDDPRPTVERDGLTYPVAWTPRSSSSRPARAAFPEAAYAACLTDDQSRALRSLERLSSPGSAVVVEADRGRGKSSAGGLAAGSLALAGQDVLVTAPAFENAAELFARASELLAERDALVSSDDRTVLTTVDGGCVRFRSPADAAALPDDPDVVVVDEAAALPVGLLEGLLAAPSVAFCTTIHGYEGAGRGFSVRFRERLDASEHAVRDVRLAEPIRYARNDPVEGWAFRALLLDARPVVDEAVAGAMPETAEYRALGGDELLADEHLLSEAFGLLVAAHYRTEPNDLARLLDAPNLSARALAVDGHVVAVALLAREGNLPAETRRGMYEGERVRGNMVPDVLTSQLRDEDAAESTGLRTVRIATHHAVRDRGFGSRLLDRIHEEFAGEVDYFAVGYGATPRLLRFWRRANYRTVHLSTTRNDASGEHSVIMLRPETDAGAALLSRHAATFRDRERDALSDAHRDVDADVVRGALRACPAPAEVDLTDHEWRVVVGASYGPGMYDVAPGAFRDLALAALIREDGTRVADGIDDRTERLFVRKVLQGRPWEHVADELGYVSTRSCMRALGDGVRPLVDRYGTDVADAERTRFRD
ncbi:tRNA(Met) cytidine acetyltransferase TmcA [Halorubrum sp. DTA98]|uniref:tRNA(Met) cytidine acetyltransferase TmcA n=1 Tax=Halorubrum sp. DTA98 TaxID=3402163 RepID=UPI003AB0AE7F